MAARIRICSKNVVFIENEHGEKMNRGGKDALNPIKAKCEKMKD
jgi:hypothetical protein